MMEMQAPSVVNVLEQNASNAEESALAAGRAQERYAPRLKGEHHMGIRDIKFATIAIESDDFG
jgi:hypothetical protein